MAQQFEVGERVLAYRFPRQGLHDATIVRHNPNNGGRGARRDVLIRYDDGVEVVAWSGGLRPPLVAARRRVPARHPVDGPVDVPAWLTDPEEALTSDELRQIRGGPSMAPRLDD